MELDEAIRILTRAGVLFLVDNSRQLSLKAAAKQLDCSVDWIRDHKDEFPNLWRMPGGELRIPERDVQALAARNKLRRSK